MKKFPLLETLFVTLVFALMVFVSCIITGSIIREHLRIETENKISLIEEQITFNLKELESMLGVVSETIRRMLLQGRSYDDIKIYITDITNFGRNSESINGFISIFGMFDIFGGAGYNGLGWEGSPDYIPEDRLWYKAASESNGEIVNTEPYVDALSHEISFTFVQSIFDEDGKRLAIVCMDIALDRISGFSSVFDGSESNYLILLDRNLNIIAHPTLEYLGLPLREVKSGISIFADELENGNNVTEQEYKSITGDKNIISIRQLKNGWYMGVATNINFYYVRLRNMEKILIVLGLIMATALNLILIRIHFAKRKAEEQVRRKSKSVIELKNAIMETMADLVERRDSNTGGHISRTSKGLQIIINAILQNKIYSEQTINWNIDQMIQSAQLHDVGKIAIDDNILRKPGKLTEEEFEIMKKHTVFGGDVIKNIQTKTNEEKEFLDYAYIFSVYHHEKWDGSGYPHGLSGEDIPLPARIMAIIDVYDALISERPYKKAFSHDEAVKIIVDGSGIQFDPLLIEAFLQTADKLKRENLN